MKDDIAIFERNVDDATPEALAGLQETLADAGARRGNGITRSSRARATHQWIAQRELETVDLEIDGETDEVTVKTASDADGEVYDGSTEDEDAKAVARETDLAIRDVIDWAESIVLS